MEFSALASVVVSGTYVLLASYPGYFRHSDFGSCFTLTAGGAEVKAMARAEGAGLEADGEAPG